MKKITLLLIITAGIIASCTKDASIPQDSVLDKRERIIEPNIAQTSIDLFAGEQAGPHLYIPEDEGGWQTGRVGLFNAYKQIGFTTVNSWLSERYGGKVAIGTPVKKVNYGCLIANGIPGESWDTTVNNPITLAGTHDLVVNNDGSQSLPLQITTYAKGGVYLGRKKDEFDYTPTDRRLNAVSGIHYSGKDYLWHGWGDNYSNDAIIPFEDGKYVIAVTMDYAPGTINPTTSLLPISVTGNTVVTDTTAIVANKAQPATNYKALLQRGKLKGVSITWQGNGYAYCIERNGQMIVKWQDTRTYFDPLGNKFSTYKIITRAQGRIPDDSTSEFKVVIK